MANRYQSFSFTTASIASAAVLQASQVLGPHLYNLVKLKVVRVTGTGNINFRIFKKGVWGSANRLARWENQGVPLLHPVDKTSGAPGVEALEGVPIPVDDEDGTNFDGSGKLHFELENLGTTSTFTISGEYEERAVFAANGDVSFRGSLQSPVQVTPTLGVATATRLGIGAAADANYLLRVSGDATTQQTALFRAASANTGSSGRVAGFAIGDGSNLQAEFGIYDNASPGGGGSDLLIRAAGAIGFAGGNHSMGAANQMTLSAAGNLTVTGTGQFARLGLGAAADASAQLYVAADGVAGLIRLRAAGSGGAAGIPNYELYRSNGTLASPTNVADTNVIGTLRTLAYSGATGFWNVTQINFVVDGAVVDNQRPGSRMDFYTNAPNAAQTLRVSFKGDGSILLNGSGSALATNATTGFTYIPSCAGTPTGTPTSYSGAVALVYDTTNNKLYAYNGAWKGVTLA